MNWVKFIILSQFYSRQDVGYASWVVSGRTKRKSKIRRKIMSLRLEEIADLLLCWGGGAKMAEHSLYTPLSDIPSHVVRERVCCCHTRQWERFLVQMEMRMIFYWKCPASVIGNRMEMLPRETSVVSKTNAIILSCQANIIQESQGAWELPESYGASDEKENILCAVYRYRWESELVEIKLWKMQSRVNGEGLKLIASKFPPICTLHRN